MKSHMLGFYAVLLLWLLVSSSVQDGIIIGSVCLTTSDTKVPPKNLVSYTNQRKPLFPVDAVRFLTISGKVICSDPTSPWAKKAMTNLDAKNKKPKKSISNKIAHQSVTTVAVNTSTTNRTLLSAQI
ncbi:C-C motif chemokine 2-like [Labeo rohita]|uniref:C-C motif chemokine 2-like n=1 Tax=Labeo rohita TaxID=84645 RepID=UPI0021E25BBC|nr:C-C motif chemokine 2-like [Labeo rohita]